MEHQKSKTQETYKLPSGILKLKYPAPEYKRNDDDILKWLKDNNPALINTVTSVKWADMKKQITVKGKTAITEDGEIIPGIEIIERNPEFKIEI